MKNIYFLLAKLQNNDKQKLLSLLFFMLLNAVIDMLGLVSIMPFIALLSNPKIVQTNSFILNINKNIGNLDFSSMIFIVGVFVFSIFILSLVVKTYVSYSIFKFGFDRESIISSMLFKKYLNKNYEWFMNKNGTTLGKNILSEVHQVVYNSLIPFLYLVANVILCLTIISVLIFVNPYIAIFSFPIIYILYFLIFKSLKGRLKKVSLQIDSSNERRFKIISNAFYSIKTTKLLNLESEYCNQFEKNMTAFSKAQTYCNVIVGLPRFFMEGVAFGGVILYLLYTINVSMQFSDIMPFIALYAFALYKLMPSSQIIYSSYAQIKSRQNLSNNIINDLNLDQSMNLQYTATNDNVNFKNLIVFNSVSYSYPNTDETALKNVSIDIEKGVSYGVVGSTGSGKSTFVDLITGLISPTHGSILIDNVSLNKGNSIKWRDSIGYVPQNIYLKDDTVASNIALGIDLKYIDFELLERVSKIAMVHDFIAKSPKGYSTIVGDHGTNLSGGQVQRIGIARALYKNPDLLILDEATSALDNHTESILVDNIHKNMSDNQTVIFIAHRLNSIRKCDNIIVLNNGIIESSGSYSELLQTEYFMKNNIKH